MEQPSVPVSVLCDFTPQWQQVTSMSRENNISSTGPPTDIEVPTSLSCEHCQKDFKEIEVYKEHMVNYHSYMPPGTDVPPVTDNTENDKESIKIKEAETENGTENSSMWAEGDIFTQETPNTINRVSTLSDGTVEVQITTELEEDVAPIVRTKRIPRPKPGKTMLVIKKKKKKPNLLRKLLEEPDDSFDTKTLTADGEIVDVEDEEKKNRLLKKGKPVVAQAREMANNVVEYFRREAKRNKFILPPTNWLKRAALATGVSVNCLLAIRKEKKETGTFSTPGLHRQRKSTITNLNENEMRLIKDEMKRVCQEGLAVTVDRMMPFAREHTSFKGGRTSLWRIMKIATKRKPRKKKEEGEKNDEDAPQPPKEKKAKLDRTPTYGEQVVETDNQAVMMPQTYTMRTDNSMPLASAEALLMLTQQNNVPSSSAMPPTTIYQQQHHNTTTYQPETTTTSRPSNILSGLVTYQPSNQHGTATTHMNLVAPALQDPITIQLELPSLLSAGIMSHGQAQYHAPQYMRPSQPPPPE